MHEKFAAVQMIDVEIPTTDGRTITLTRHTEPEPELKLLLERLRLEVPAQSPPKFSTAQVETATPIVVQTFELRPISINKLPAP